VNGSPRNLHIRRLAAGGLITNYYCTSRCGHCLYACSPGWEKRYIDAATARENFRKIKELGCPAVHVGGGEPFLNPEGLKTVLRVAREEGVQVEYVETNSSWFTGPEAAADLLTDLRNLGLDTLLISISPFHNEYIPFSKVKGVIAACRGAGMTAFPWINDFYREVEALGDREPHRLSEYAARYGAEYLRRLPSRYWIHFGGRALMTFGEVLETRDCAALLAQNPRGCTELLDVRHFHLDLFGHYIPGLCSGLAIRRDDLGAPLDPERHPFLTTLFNGGIQGLLELAGRGHGFRAAARYLSKCHLCLDIRRFLVLERQLTYPELQPRAFYENL
jgi:hypothetical protein